MPDQNHASDGIHVSVTPSAVVSTILQPRDSIVIYQVLEPELDAIGRAHDEENLSFGFFGLTASLSISTIFTAMTATTVIAVAIAWSMVVCAGIIAVYFCVRWRNARKIARQGIERIRSRVDRKEIVADPRA